MTLAPGTSLGAYETLSADESRIIVGTGTAMSDIWLLEQFEPAPASWARWLRR